MDHVKLFEIKSNSAMQALIESIPDTWIWVDGLLEAPKNLIASGDAIEHTGFSLSRFHTIKPTIIGRKKLIENGEVFQYTTDVYGIMVERKLPGFLLLDEAGMSGPALPMSVVKKIIAGFVGQGYSGRLTFYRDYRDNNKYRVSARCDLINHPWNSNHIKGLLPPRIKLDWNDSYGGTAANIQPMLDICHQLELHEYMPETDDVQGVQNA